MYLFKVWDSTREKREFVIIKTEKEIYENLILKASQKLEKNGVSLVLEKDGTRVDDDEILVLLREETFMLLENGDKWRPVEELSSTLSVSSIRELDTSFDTNTPIIFDVTDNLIPEIGNVTVIPPSLSDCKIISYSVWNNFEIPWTKLPNYTLRALEEKKRERGVVTEVVQLIVNEMREISQVIPTNAFKIIGKKLVHLYPNTFQDTDNEGVVLGDVCHSIVTKLVDRNCYLNRPHKRKVLSPLPRNKLTKLLAARAGCSNWQPDHSNNCIQQEKENLKITENENDNEFWNILEKTCPEQRKFLNNLENIPTIHDIRREFPALLTKNVIRWHFSKLTGSSQDEMLNNIEERIKLIINFSEIKKIIKLPKNTVPNFWNSIEVVAKYFKEDTSVILTKNSDSKSITSPCIVESDSGMFTVIMEDEKILESSDLTESFFITFAMYFNFNLQYPRDISNTMEFVQRFFF